MGRLNIIWLNGPPGSGKDSGAKYLKQVFGDICYTTKLAQPIENGIRSVFSHIDIETWKILREANKDLPTSELFNKTLREVFISFSEDWMKKKFGTDVFGQLAIRHLEKVLSKRSNIRIVVFSDAGFVEEVKAVANRFGLQNNQLIRIHRNGCDFSFDSRSYLVNTGLNEIDIYNNADIEEFYKKLVSICKRVYDA